MSADPPSASRISVRVPATSANLGPGFDCLGLTLDLWGQLTFTASDRPAPATDDPVLDMAARAFQRPFAGLQRQPPPGLAITYDGAVPVARGLGASAIARAAGLLAANAVLGDPLDREELLALGTDLEGHADNMAPALFGGLQVVARDETAIHHIGLPLPAGLKAVLFVPEFTMPTQKSRRVLPKSLSRADAVHNTGRAALLVAALATGRLDALDAASQDRLHQPARSQIFPAMYDLFQAARDAGAHCAYLSGGGSTVCALASDHEAAIASAMADTAHLHGVAGETMITAPTEGAGQVVEGS
jgi:homoserine kinase